MNINKDLCNEFNCTLISYNFINNVILNFQSVNKICSLVDIRKILGELRYYSYNYC